MRNPALGTQRLVSQQDFEGLHRFKDDQDDVDMHPPGQAGFGLLPPKLFDAGNVRMPCQQVDPGEAKERICTTVPAFVVNTFTSAYKTYIAGKKVEFLRLTDPESDPDMSGLVKAADAVEEAVERAYPTATTNHEIVGWPKPLLDNDRRTKMDDFANVYNWLVAMKLVSGLKVRTYYDAKAAAANADLPLMVDDEQGLRVVTRTIIHTARTDAKLLPEILTVGYGDMRKVLTNYVGHGIFASMLLRSLLIQIQGNSDECLNCMDRNHNYRFYYDNPKANNLKCGCNFDLACLDFWLFKTTANVEGVPHRTPGPGHTAGVKKATMMIHENALMVVRAGIQEVSGLTTKQLYSRREHRLADTSVWALKRLIGQLSKFPEHAATVESLAPILGKLEKALVPIHSIQLPNRWDPLEPQPHLEPEDPTTAVPKKAVAHREPVDDENSGSDTVAPKKVAPKKSAPKKSAPRKAASKKAGPKKVEHPGGPQDDSVGSGE